MTTILFCENAVRGTDHVTDNYKWIQIKTIDNKRFRIFFTGDDNF